LGGVGFQARVRPDVQDASTAEKKSMSNPFTGNNQPSQDSFNLHIWQALPKFH
jgi:hypothetical protein